MQKERVDWPEDILEAKKARSDRLAALFAIKDQNYDYVDKLLSENIDNMTVFNLITIVETTYPERAKLSNWQNAFDTLLLKLKADDYSDNLIEHVKKTLA